MFAQLTQRDRVGQGGRRQRQGLSGWRQRGASARPLDERIKTATEASLVRMFPRFKEADSAAWEAVIKRAREGADHPFQPTGHTGRHRETRGLPAGGLHDWRRQVGLGYPQGARRNPFGWPRDAVDAALIALHRLAAHHGDAERAGAASRPA